jgi:putative ABC transport system substrate-binding protein
MNRREAITLLGGAAAWPLAAHAQQGNRARRIGVLMWGDENDPEVKLRYSAFTQALAGLGWTDGRNVRMDLRWHGYDINRIPVLAQELAGLQPDIIVTAGALGTAAAQRDTRTIPIVFATAVDPVASCIVAGLNQPGGNATGFAYYEPTLGGKWLELLSEIAPGLKRAAITFNPDLPGPPVYMPGGDQECAICGPYPRAAFACLQRNDRERDRGSLCNACRSTGRCRLSGRQRATRFQDRSNHIARGSLCVTHHVSLWWSRARGGSFELWTGSRESIRLAGVYTGRILKGEKPADLPVQLSTRFEFIINLKTARALRHEIPPLLLALADEVIE